MVLAAIVAGCGGDSGTSSAETGPAETGGKAFDVRADTTMTTGSLTKAQFITHLNKTCRVAWVTISSNLAIYRGEKHPQVKPGKEFEEATHESLLPGIDFHIFDNVRILGAPEGEEQQIEEIFGAMQESVERGATMPISSAAQLEALFKDYNQLAHQYGLDDCLVDQARLSKFEA